MPNRSSTPSLLRTRLSRRDWLSFAGKGAVGVVVSQSLLGCMWHCDAGGLYSDESANGTFGNRYLRGYQITDANGIASFTTIYPGWYSGRAVHVHFKLRLFAGATKTYEFTSQFFFDETLTSTVHALSRYSIRGTRNTLNSTDGIYNSLTTAQKAVLTLQTSQSGDGYAGVINLGVQIA
jgi:protocatechuate 3,4-dioxygenase beta subunit